MRRVACAAPCHDGGRVRVHSRICGYVPLSVCSRVRGHGAGGADMEGAMEAEDLPAASAVRATHAPVRADVT